MGNTPDIKLSEEIIPEVTKIGNVMEHLGACSEKLDVLLNGLATEDPYEGSAREEAFFFYNALKGHTDTLTLLYGMALQQAFASFAEIWAADAAGVGG